MRLVKLVSAFTIAFSVLSFFPLLPPRLVGPGFGPFVLFQYLPLLFALAGTLCLAGALLYEYGGSRFVALLVCLVYATLVLDIWVAQAPGGSLLTDGQSYAATTLAVIHGGRLDVGGATTEPGMFAISSTISLITRLSISDTLLIWSYLRAILIGLTTFIVARRFLDSYRLVAIAVCLSIVADSQILKLSPYNDGTFGFVFFMLAVVVLMNLPMPRLASYGILFLVMLASIVTYTIVPFAIILFALYSAVQQKLTGRIPFARRGVTNPITSPISVALAVVLPYVGWAIFDFNYLFAPASDLLSNMRSLLFSHSGLSGGGAHVGLLFSLVQLLAANVGASPLDLGYLVPIWFLFLYGGGIVLWFLATVRHKAILLPDSYVIGSLIIVGLVLFLLIGGAEWIRVLPYFAPFLSVTILAWIQRAPKGRWIALSIMTLVLLFTIPSVAVNLPLVGVGGAVYPAGLAGGAFTNAYRVGSAVFSGGGLATLNYTLYSKITSPVK